MMTRKFSQFFRSRSDLTSVLSVMSGNLATTFISLSSSILIARWIEPDAMGLWSIALLFILYLSQLQFGVLNGLNRQLPYYLGANQKEISSRMAQVSLTWCLALSFATCVATFLVAFWFWHSADLLHFKTAIVVGILIALFWPTQYLTITYRTMSDFARLARKNTLTALFGLGLTGLVWWLGYAGLMLRAVGMAAVMLLTLYYRKPITVRPIWNGSVLVQLVRVGVPIWLSGQVGTFMMSLDRIVLTGSTRELGLYYVSTQVGILVSMIPSAFGMVLYPKMAQRYGETGSARDLWDIAAKGAMLSIVMSGLLAIVVWTTVPLFVESVLPFYVDGTRAAQWTSLLGVALSLSIFNNVFNVIGRQDVFLACAAAGFAIFFGAWFLLSRSPDLSATSSAAQSILIAALVSSVLSAILSKATCSSHDRNRVPTDLTT